MVVPFGSLLYQAWQFRGNGVGWLFVPIAFWNLGAVRNKNPIKKS